jgi:hypothetical protein
MVCGGGEADRFLELSLKEFKRLCDDAIIATNNATQKEKDLISKYGFWQYEDNREWGKEQNKIKDSLLLRVRRLNPDWILALDADETLPSLTRQQIEELVKEGVSFYFYVVNLWNDEEHYMRSMSFWNIRLYKNLPVAGSTFQRTPLHCGLAPPFFYKHGTYTPHIMLHRGLMKKKNRERKAERYQKYDPNAKYKSQSYYDALLMDGSGTEYKEEQVLTKLNNYCQTIKKPNEKNKRNS